MPGHDSACHRAYTCLARHQRLSGGVATYAESEPIRQYMGLGRWVPFRGWCRPQIEVSAAAGRALCALRSDVARASADAAWRYVKSRQNGDGSWNSYWWISPHFATQQAVTLALSMRDPDPVRSAAAWVFNGQHHDGGWGLPGESEISSFATALSLSVLAVSGLDYRRPIAGGIDALVCLQQADGGWPSHPALRISPTCRPKSRGRRSLAPDSIRSRDRRPGPAPHVHLRDLRRRIGSCPARNGIGVVDGVMASTTGNDRDVVKADEGLP